MVLLFERGGNGVINAIQACSVDKTPRKIIKKRLAYILLLMYIRNMASLQRYVSKGCIYWRLVESKRINGKPRLFVVAHLGTAETLMKRLNDNHGKPVKSKVRSFGGITALASIASELGLVEIIDRHVDKRGQGISVGTYIVLAALNRCLAPCSKNQFERWHRKTAMPSWLSVDPENLTSQRFWDHMEYIDSKAIRRIEEDVVRRLIEHFQIDPSLLAFDCTNFDTFIDTETSSDLAQRGHAKSKRNDLRLVGLALAVSREFNVPLFSEIYSGNRHDSKSFESALEILSERISIFEKGCDSLTLVFDKGNNSETNQTLLERTGYHFVGSLVPTHHDDLLAIPVGQFSKLEDARYEGTKAFRTTKEIFGVLRTIVVTRSQTLFEKQVRGIEQELGKKKRLLDDLAQKLRRSQRLGARGKPYTETSLGKAVATILHGQHMKNLFLVRIDGAKGRLRLSHHIKAVTYRQLKERVLGKRILFTDQDTWTTEAIIEAYRAQFHVENTFRRMKNSFFVSWSPMWHWTDSKIRVHALCCLLALVLAGLLQRRLFQQGIQVSVDKMLSELNDIEEIENFYMSGPTGRPRSVKNLSELNPLQKKMWQGLNLKPVLSL